MGVGWGGRCCSDAHGVAWNRGAREQRLRLLPTGWATLREMFSLSAPHCPHLKNVFFFTGCEEGLCE